MTSSQIKTVFIRLSSLFLVLVLVAMAILGNRMLGRLPGEMAYFVETKDSHFTLKAVLRNSAASSQADRLKIIVNALIEGPNSDERKRGLSSSLPKDTKLLSLTVDGKEVSVDFSKELLEPQGISSSIAMLNQIYYSLSYPKNIDSVSLLVQGEPLYYLGGEGIVVDQPWYKKSDKLPIW